MNKILKPKIGEPCNGCGLCCQIQVCRNGAYVLKLVNNLGDTVPGPCPALTPKTDSSFSCGIIENPNKYIKKSKYPAKVLSKHFANLVGTNTGCDELGYSEDFLEEQKLQELTNSKLADKNFVKSVQNSLKIVHNI